MSELGQQRHRARERALEILYEANIKERPIAEIVAALHSRPTPTPLPSSPPRASPISGRVTHK